MNIAGQYEGVRKERARERGRRGIGREEKSEREIKEKEKKDVITGRKVERVKGSMES